jgi:hypothetical protein
VSTPTPEAQTYRVVFSVLAQTALRELVEKAKARGCGGDALRALRTLDERLRIYPQFGEPIRDYPALDLTEYRGHVWQITLTYAVDEQRRIVHVAAAPKPLPFGLLADD